MSDLGFPTRLAAAGVLLTDPDGLTLLVRTHSRTELVLPGGMVEADEPPAAAAEREVREEVGLNVVVTRLLTVQHRIAGRGLPERMMFVFDSAPLPNRPRLVLQAEEIAEAFWLTPEDAVARHVEGGRSRLDEAFAARLGGFTTYLTPIVGSRPGERQSCRWHGQHPASDIAHPVRSCPHPAFAARWLSRRARDFDRSGGGQVDGSRPGA